MKSDIPLFSVLVPSIPSRIKKFLVPLLNKLQGQIGEENVEVLTLIDNKKRSVGLKRDSLMQQSRGKYVAFVDDDDEISDDYVSSIVSAIKENYGVDLIVFNQQVTINDGNPFLVDFSVDYENQEAGHDEHGIWQNIKRSPFHVCVWRSEIAKKYSFPDASYGEDWYWAKQAKADVTTQYKIDKILHFYRYSDKITEAALVYPEDNND